MQAHLLRRLSPLLAMVALLAAQSGCKPTSEGTVRVVVIGNGPPKVADPAVAPLSKPDAVLTANVAQGLVRFDAGGNIVAGLAERWNVSNDGLSYIFRLASTNWPDGAKLTAQQVARILKREIGPRSRDPLRDVLGGVEDVVAMTDRVLEIRLVAPRPNLLPLLAQPEFAIMRDGAGTGPFQISSSASSGGDLRLTRQIELSDEEASRREELLLGTSDTARAVGEFVQGQSDLVLGGTFADLPIATRVRLPRGSLRFDPASGLFGLVPTMAHGPFDSADKRRLLSEAIDRSSLVDSLAVPGLAARATVLEPGLDGTLAPVAPAWFGTPLTARHAALTATATRLFGAEKPPIRLALPVGPGADLLFARLAADWSALGFQVVRAIDAAGADFILIDQVAPSSSPAWFVRSFRCGAVPLCDPDADTLMQAAREAPVPAQRYAFLAQAAGIIDSAQLFIPLTAPVRWSLVGSRIQGFTGNRYASHTLTDLEQKLGVGE